MDQESVAGWSRAPVKAQLGGPTTTRATRRGFASSPQWRILSGVYRARLELEWRAAMAVAVAAVAVAVTSRLPLPVDGWWLLAAFGAVVLIAAGTVLTEVWRRPLPWAAPSAAFRERELTAAATKVSRGQHVDPPELQTAAIDRARDGLRPLLISTTWPPVLGCAWTVSSGHGGSDTVMNVLGPVVIVGGLAGLGYIRRTLYRLDTLECTNGVAATGADGAGRQQR